MDEHPEFDPREEQSEPQQPAVVRPRTAGAPLSAGASRHNEQTPVAEHRRQFLSDEPPHPDEEPTQAPEFPSLQRAAGFVRSAVPILQRLLPLLDGNFATVVGNLVAARTNARSSNKVDLTPIENGLSELRFQQHTLRLEVTEQNILLKAVEDQLAIVRDATSRHMLQQQEALEDLKASAKKAMVVAVIALLLAAGSLATVVVLILRMKKVLP